MMPRPSLRPAAPAKPATSPGGEPQAVMFDMDGLLVDSEPLWFEAEREVMARLGGRWTTADQDALVGGSLQRTVSYLLARAARPADRADVARSLIDGMLALLAERSLPVLPGAAELVAEVAAAGLPYALVTSSEREIMDAVLAKIAVPFAVTVCAADVLRGKPDPEPYLLAAALVSADPRRCVAIEDSTNGVASAHAAGCRVLAVPSLTPIAPADRRLVTRSLSQVSLETLRDLVRQ